MLEDTPPRTEAALMTRCQALVGLTVGQLARRCHLELPEDPLRAKGFLGGLLEKALVTTAKNQALPDFLSLGVELKSLPINEEGRPAESTFVSSLSLLHIHREYWERSSCYLKLRRILWVPLESSRAIPIKERRIGQAFLWSPDAEDLKILKEDWTLLTSMVVLGQLEDLAASLGTYLQVRPKAAHSAVLCDAFGALGERVKTLPRGFYLRRSFTTKIWQEKGTKDRNLPLMDEC